MKREETCIGGSFIVGTFIQGHIYTGGTFIQGARTLSTLKYFESFRKYLRLISCFVCRMQQWVSRTFSKIIKITEHVKLRTQPYKAKKLYIQYTITYSYSVVFYSVASDHTQIIYIRNILAVAHTIVIK